MTNPSQPPSAWRSTRRTLILVLLAWLITAAIAGVSYVALGHVWVPIFVGVALGIGFATGVALLHRAAWLALLSIAPGAFVLIGAVQFAPEAALEQRGVTERVVLTVDEEATSGNHNAFSMVTEDGRRLDQDFVYQGSNPPYRSGDRLAVVVDPEGVVEPEDSRDVDPAEERGHLVGGAVGWTLVALCAGWRGHVRRRKGRNSSPLAAVLDLASA
ncbi:hypothetical protein AB0M28_06590 [Streptomyces sp. NPDC051940]|uniref:hypothetical protein n=1 Tax=Streptomyces sp. NPDC051940 TaxID=3155675 RepID=UPI0034204526